MQPSSVNTKYSDVEVIYSTQPDSQMPGLNDKDKEEIRAMIANHKPGGIPLWIKESTALAIVLGGAAFIVHTYIPAQIGHQTSSMASDLATVKESVSTLKTDVGDIKKEIKDALNRALDRVLQSSPIKPRSTKATGGALRLGNRIVDLANSFKVKLDPAILSNYGKEVLSISVSDSDPALRADAQRGVGLALNQRTFINSDFVPPLPQLDPSTPDIVARFEKDQPYPGTMQWRGHWVPKSGGAWHNLLGRDQNAELSLLPEYLLVEGAIATLDGLQLKNVVYRNSRIIYKGGPMLMTNIYFVNCTFDIVQDPNGSRFTWALMDKVPVSFEASS